MEKEIESKMNQSEDICNMNPFEFKSFIKQPRQQYNQKAVEQKNQGVEKARELKKQAREQTEKAADLKKQARELRKTILC